jgi:hypothetical protein
MQIVKENAGKNYMLVEINGEDGIVRPYSHLDLIAQER